MWSWSIGDSASAPASVFFCQSFGSSSSSEYHRHCTIELFLLFATKRDMKNSSMLVEENEGLVVAECERHGEDGLETYLIVHISIGK